MGQHHKSQHIVPITTLDLANRRVVSAVKRAVELDGMV